MLKNGINNEVRLNVQVRNNGEDAHEAALTVVLPSSLTYRNIDPIEASLN